MKACVENITHYHKNVLCADDYLFWQNSDDSLTGYKTPNAVLRDSGAELVMLSLTLNKRGSKDNTGFCNSSGTFCVHRLRAFSTGSGPCEIVQPIKGGRGMTLLNLMHSPKGSPLAQVAALFTKIESLGYILAWSESEENRATVDRIELPRLRLTFEARVMNGETKFFCLEHADYFISEKRLPDTDRLLVGIPCHLLLENSCLEFSAVVNAAVKPFRPNQQEHFPSALLLDRADTEWTSKASMPYYFLQFHISRKFLLMPSLASLLYILLLRFYAREYSEIFKIVNSCVSDVELTKEERQVKLF